LLCLSFGRQSTRRCPAILLHGWLIQGELVPKHILPLLLKKLLNFV
jgi:hypothetical protein